MPPFDEVVSPRNARWAAIFLRAAEEGEDHGPGLEGAALARPDDEMVCRLRMTTGKTFAVELLPDAGGLA